MSIIRSSTGLLLVFVLSTWCTAQSTWRTDSLMVTWPIQQRLQELITNRGRGVVRAVDTKDLYTELANEAPSIPVFADAEVEAYTDLYGEPQREQFRFLLGMCAEYFPMIEAALAAQDLPNDLKYLPMALSAMNVHAGSRDGGAGLWMLTYPVAVRYGLTVTADMDERHDAVKSTEAAVRYLKDLYARYTEPSLAIMAFACGPANVTRAQQRTGGATDFRTLYPEFTEGQQDVMPLLMAFIHLTANGERLGLTAIHPAAPGSAESMPVPETLQLTIVARVMQLPEAQLRSLNPTLCGGRIPAGHPFQVPIGTGVRFGQRADSLARAAMRIAKEEPVNSNLNSDKLVSVLVEKSIRYRVRSGDNLGLIAQRHHVSVKQLKAWNHLRSDRINAGQTLVIHTKKREWVKPTVEPEPSLPDDEEPTNSIVPVTNTSAITPHVRGSEPLSYTVRSGDSLFGIARRYPGLSAERIREVNGIGNNIHPGQELTIPRP
ncbi:MAG: LysM peptidoglycan-binding domain-containing protein [Flavobacteriales bacterium]|nr:LysM peptidoglycan-binding domain-containing protein [Flavobacteriales bacterium]